MRRMWFLAGVLAFTGCQPAEHAPSEPAAETDMPAMSDEDMLRALTDEFEQAVSNQDVKAIGAKFVEDADLVDQAGVMHHGRMAIEERYQKLFDGPYKGAKAALEVTSIRLVTPAVAVIDGTYELTGIKSADGADMPAVQGMFTNVAVKQNDQWMLHCSRPMLPVKAPGT